jgi:hypothetical protein
VTREVLIEAYPVAELVPERVPTELGHGVVRESDLDRIRRKCSETSFGDEGILTIFFRRLLWLCSEKKMYADSS